MTAGGDAGPKPTVDPRCCAPPYSASGVPDAHRQGCSSGIHLMISPGSVTESRPPLRKNVTQQEVASTALGDAAAQQPWESKGGAGGAAGPQQAVAGTDAAVGGIAALSLSAEAGGDATAPPSTPQQSPRTAPTGTVAHMSTRRRLLNIFGLSLGWCLVVSIMFIQISTSTLAAKDYNGSATATLPAGATNVAAMLSAIPGTLLMRRFGRRPVMLLPALAAIGGAALMAVAARLRLLWLLCVASIPFGVAFAQAQNFRFAALEFSPAGFENNALSLVVTGAMLSSVVGPEVARHTRNALPTPYVATYIFVTGLCVLYAVLLTLIEFHRAPELAAAKEAAAAAVVVVVAAETASGEAVAGASSRSATDGGLMACSDARTPTRDKLSSTAGAAAAAAAPGCVAGAQSDGKESTPLEAQSQGSSGPSAHSEPGHSAHVAHEQLTQPACSTAGGKPGQLAAEPQPPAPLPAPPRPLSHLLLSWQYTVPVITASLAYCAMAGIMTASPLIIRDTGYDFDRATQVIQVHILCMFVPSLFTGEVMRLITPQWTMLAGSCVLTGGAALFYVGERLSVYFAGNSLVGLGWNWAYVGGSALVSKVYRPEEKFQAQGVMDSLVLLLSGIPSLVAGFLYDWLGWRNYMSVFVFISGSVAVLDTWFVLSVLRVAKRA